jgi:hypothetical protein
MSNRWKAVAVIVFLCAGVTAQAAGAQSEPKQKGAEKGAPAASDTNSKKRSPIIPYQPPDGRKGMNSAPPASELIRD